MQKIETIKKSFAKQTTQCATFCIAIMPHLECPFVRYICIKGQSLMLELPALQVY